MHTPRLRENSDIYTRTIIVRATPLRDSPLGGRMDLLQQRCLVVFLNIHRCRFKGPAALAAAGGLKLLGPLAKTL